MNDSVVRDEIAGVILAGGRSSRMGLNKMWLPFGEGSLVETVMTKLLTVFSEVVVVTDEPERYASYPVSVTQDQWVCSSKNALVGIHAGLSFISHEKAFVIGGDMPFVNAALIHHICNVSDQYDLTIPLVNGFHETLCAVYRTSCVAIVEQRLLAEKFRVRDLVKLTNVREVTEDELSQWHPHSNSFLNINTRDDYQRALELRKRGVYDGANRINRW